MMDSKKPEKAPVQRHKSTGLHSNTRDKRGFLRFQQTMMDSLFPASPGLLPRCLSWLLLAFLAAGTTTPCLAEEAKAPEEPVSLVTILDQDHQGEAMRFPSGLAYDPEQEELYLISGGKRGFIIYDSGFFPHLFLGAGRGIDAPQGIFFNRRDGRVFVCQGPSTTRPARLTILNGAFFPVNEILFDQIPGAEDFSPLRGTIGKTGNIYLAGVNNRGVLVLDPDGKFLRWLKPLDTIHLQEEERVALEKQTAGQPVSPASTGITDDPGDNPLGLPEELLPKSRLKSGRTATGPGQGPVTVNDIISDSEGHLFLLSEETSKVYVYASSEEFIFSFGQKGGSSGKMSRPRGLAMDETRKSIYLVDYMRHTILVYDTAGKYLFEFGGRGDGPLWFNFPTSITVDRRGQIYIADLFNNRVQVLKANFDVRFPIFQVPKTPSPPAPAEPAGTEEEKVVPAEGFTTEPLRDTAAE